METKPKRARKPKPTHPCPLCKKQLYQGAAESTQFYQCSAGCPFIGLIYEGTESIRNVEHKLARAPSERQAITEESEKEIWEFTNEIEREYDSAFTNLSDEPLARAFRLFCKILREI